MRQTKGLEGIQGTCQERNISEVIFHRWKKKFGQMDINEAKRLEKPELENSELKKMLAEALLKNRVLEFACEKSCEPPGIAKR